MMYRILIASFLVACGGAAPEIAAPAPDGASADNQGAEREVTPDADATNADAEWQTFGTPPASATTPLQAKAFLDDPSTYADQWVTVEGEVTDVCQKMGCWMVVTDGERSMRVTMKDHAFSVAKDGAGATARVHGQVVRKAIDPASVAHYASESAKPDAMPEQGKEAGEATYEIVASAVDLKRTAKN